MLDYGSRECEHECSKNGVLRGDQRSLYERHVATEMGEAKTSNIAVDSSAERQVRVFVMCAKHDIPEIRAKLLMKVMYEERHRHE